MDIRPKQKKTGLHPQNIHRNPYDFNALIATLPSLKSVMKTSDTSRLTIDFSDPKAVMLLNTALLQHHYSIKNWSLPTGALCPAVPGRADYIHRASDLFATTEKQNLKMLDIGTGASGIYALLGSRIYHWQCVVSDINQSSLDTIETLLLHNRDLNIETRLQANPHHIFEGIIRKEDMFDLSVCNPPFHAPI